MQTMAEHDQVLKYWGAIEADYTGNGGEVLTRSVPASIVINVHAVC